MHKEFINCLFRDGFRFSFTLCGLIFFQHVVREIEEQLKYLVMNMKTWRIIGGSVLAAGLLVYPVMRLVRFIQDKRASLAEGEDGEKKTKAFSPSYRGKHKPHHRHATNQNGHLGHQA
jgi:hypothetical protein